MKSRFAEVNTDRSDERYVHAMILRVNFPDHPTSAADPGGGPSH
jgi:hypothetical protein